MEQGEPEPVSHDEERGAASHSVAPVTVRALQPSEVTLDEAAEYVAVIQRNRDVLWLTTPIALAITCCTAGIFTAAIPSLYGGPALVLTGIAGVLYVRLMKRYLDRAAETRLRPSLPWREIIRLESSAGVRELDDPAARMHKKLSKAERLQRFHASIVRRLSGGEQA